MPYADSGVTRIYYEAVGRGIPLVFLHEFAGDHRSWREQMRALSRSYRCITIAARGYPPSDVPADDAAYSQDIANRDVIAVLDAEGIARSHVVGLSMGAYTALQLTLQFPDRLLSAVAAGAGSGSERASREQFLREAAATASLMEKATRIDAEQICLSSTRVQLLNKDEIGWRMMVEHLADHPPQGSARVLRNVQGKRPSLYDLEAELAAAKTPVLLIVGDEDEPCLDVNLFMKRTMPTAQLAMLPGSGHPINHEEPALFAQLVERFLMSVDRGTWQPRDPRASTALGQSFAAILPSAGR